MKPWIASATAVCAAFSLSSAAAPTPDPEAGDAIDALDAIVVTASKTEEAAGESSAAVPVIDDAHIERRLVRDIKSLVRYEPGVSVANDATLDLLFEDSVHSAAHPAAAIGAAR